MAINYIFPIRATQAGFALITLGLEGYVAHWYVVRAGVPSPSQVNILIFASIWTMFATVYLAVSPVYFPSVSHKYAVLAVDTVTAVFWFAGFLALGVFLAGLELCLGTVCNCARAGVVFAAFVWVLFMATSILAAVHVWRTRHSLDTKPAPQQPVASQRI